MKSVEGSSEGAGGEGGARESLSWSSMMKSAAVRKVTVLGSFVVGEEIGSSFVS